MHMYVYMKEKKYQASNANGVPHSCSLLKHILLQTLVGSVNKTRKETGKLPAPVLPKLICFKLKVMLLLTEFLETVLTVCIQLLDF